MSVRTQATGSEIGMVTSGCPSPSLSGKTSVAMGYISLEEGRTKAPKSGTEVVLEVRKGKTVEAK